MKAFLLAVVAMAALSAGAWVVLTNAGLSSAEVYQKPGSVRLD